MNRFLIHEGGQPVCLDDLDFIQQATADALKAICAGFRLGSGNILLSDPVSIGTSGTDTVYTVIGNGYIVMGDEVYPIQPGSLTVPASQPVYWVVVREKYQKETLADNTEVQIYERRYVKLSATYADGDTYANRNDVVTFMDKILATVSDNMDKTVAEKDMKAVLSLNGVVSGKAEMTYYAKQSGEETVHINVLAVSDAGTSMTVPEVNGRRRLCTFDSAVKSISGTFTLTMSYANSWDNVQSMPVQLTFSNGNCYIASDSGSPLSQMPASSIVIDETIKI